MENTTVIKILNIKEVVQLLSENHLIMDTNNVVIVNDKDINNAILNDNLTLVTNDKNNSISADTYDTSKVTTKVNPENINGFLKEVQMIRNASLEKTNTKKNKLK